MDSHIGLEALSQRGRSPLFLDLISVYQEAFAALRGAPKASHKDIVDVLRRQCKFPDKLKTVIRRHMGLTIRRVVVVDGVLPNMMAITATPFTPPSRKNPTWTLNMAQVAVTGFYDDRKGKFTASPTGASDQTMEIAVTSGWWKLRGQAGDYVFTATEAAAITLHELGHFDHRIRVFGRIEKTLVDAADIVRYVKTTPDLATIDLILVRLSKSPYLDPHWRKLLEVTKAYFDSNPNYADPVYLEAVNTLTILIEADLSEMLLPQFTQLVYGSKLRSAEVRTTSHETDEERAADEFAARHGAYAEVVSFLHKSSTLLTTDSKTWLVLLVPDILATTIGALIHFGSYFHLSAEDVGYGYDAMIRRMELLIETAQHAFADTNLPDEIKQEIMEKITLCETYLHDYANTRHRKVRLALKAWRDRVAVVGTILTTPFDDRLQRDYGNLQEATRKLSRNPLYYLAHK